MTEPFTASLCIFSLLGSKLTTKGIKYLHTYSCLYIYIYTLGTLGYLPTCFLNTFPRESLEPWLEAEAFPHAAARARVAGVWNHGLWATNKGETFCRLYPPVFLLIFFFFFYSFIFAPVDLSVTPTCAKAASWGLSMKHIAVDLCFLSVSLANPTWFQAI